jgi:CBS domain-containing protein
MKLDQLAQTPVGQIQTRNALIVEPSTTTFDVIKAMRAGSCGAALITDADGKLAGIFSERDVLVKVGNNGASMDGPVSELMTANPRTTAVTDSVSAALAAMREGDFRHLPIIDEDGAPAGIVSVRDILAWVADHFPKAILNLPPRPRRGNTGMYGG